MKTIITLSISIFCFQLLLAQPGSLDPSFSGDGIVIFSQSPIGGSFGSCVAIQPDNKVIIGGNVLKPLSNFDNDYALSRLNVDGTLDNTFGNGGLVQFDFNSRYATVDGLIIQPDGKIVAAGGSHDTITQTVGFAVFRCDRFGEIDSTFGHFGITKTKIDGNAVTTCIALQNDHKILVGGYCQIDTQMYLALARYHPDGLIDSSFSNDGILIQDLGKFDARIFGIAVQPDGKIVATGYHYYGNNNGGTYYFITRYLPNGEPDPSFGVNGIIENKFSTNNNPSYGHSVAILPDGRILIGGYSGGNIIYGWALACYNQNGILDAFFGNNGILFPETHEGVGIINKVLIQPDGKILAAGWVKKTSGATIGKIAVARFYSNGTYDSTFAANGIQVIQVAPVGISVNIGDAALDSDGNIVLAGNTTEDLIHRTIVVRLLSDLNVGVLDFSNEPNTILVYPNPVAVSATLQYTLPARQTITVQLFGQTGNLQATLVNNQEQTPGAHSLPIVLPDELPPGVYFLSISTGKLQRTVRIMKK